MEVLFRRSRTQSKWGDPSATPSPPIITASFPHCAEVVCPLPSPEVQQPPGMGTSFLTLQSLPVNIYILFIPDASQQGSVPAEENCTQLHARTRSPLCANSLSRTLSLFLSSFDLEAGAWQQNFFPPGLIGRPSASPSTTPHPPARAMPRRVRRPIWGFLPSNTARAKRNTLLKIVVGCILHLFGKK